MRERRQDRKRGLEDNTPPTPVKTFCSLQFYYRPQPEITMKTHSYLFNGYCVDCTITEKVGESEENKGESLHDPNWVFREQSVTGVNYNKLLPKEEETRAVSFSSLLFCTAESRLSHTEEKIERCRGRGNYRTKAQTQFSVSLCAPRDSVARPSDREGELRKRLWKKKYSRKEKQGRQLGCEGNPPGDPPQKK